MINYDTIFLSHHVLDISWRYTEGVLASQKTKTHFILVSLFSNRNSTWWLYVFLGAIWFTYIIMCQSFRKSIAITTTVIENVFFLISLFWRFRPSCNSYHFVEFERRVSYLNCSKLSSKRKTLPKTKPFTGSLSSKLKYVNAINLSLFEYVSN